MVSPRLRAAVPLPTPVDTTRLRRVLAARMLTALAAWVLPALLAPPAWLTMLGIANPTTELLMFVRLCGAVSLAIVVGQIFAWRMPMRHPATLLITVVADAMSAIVIVSAGAGGSFALWSNLASTYVWASAVALAGFAGALATSGQALLRRLTERPRPGSVKIM